MKKTNKKGFTIVELVIVIAVIGILAAILIPTFVNLTENARANALQANLRNAYTAYLADAEDGEVDGEDAYLEIKDMDEVVLADGETLASANGYVWNGESWVVGKNPSKPSADASAWAGVKYTLSGNTKNYAAIAYNTFYVFFQTNA